MQKKQSRKTHDVRSIGADALESVRGGYNDSGVSEQNRVIERHEVPTSSSGYVISIPRDTTP